MEKLIYLPRESPIWKRFASAQLFSESDGEDGICHALGFPPTRKYLASVNVKRRGMKMREDTRTFEEAMNGERETRRRKRREEFQLSLPRCFVYFGREKWKNCIDQLCEICGGVGGLFKS